MAKKDSLCRLRAPASDLHGRRVQPRRPYLPRVGGIPSEWSCAVWVWSRSRDPGSFFAQEKIANIGRRALGRIICLGNLRGRARRGHRLLIRVDSRHSRPWSAASQRRRICLASTALPTPGRLSWIVPFGSSSWSRTRAAQLAPPGALVVRGHLLSQPTGLRAP